jgi:hypothetical protein
MFISFGANYILKSEIVAITSNAPSRHYPIVWGETYNVTIVLRNGKEIVFDNLSHNEIVHAFESFEHYFESSQSLDD